MFQVSHGEAIFHSPKANFVEKITCQSKCFFLSSWDNVATQKITAEPCISSIPKELYIIKPQVDTRWRVMRYNNGSAVVDDIHRTSRGDDIPSLSAWIKKSKSFDLDFLAPPAGLEPATTWLTVRCSTDWAKEEYILQRIEDQTKTVAVCIRRTLSKEHRREAANEFQTLIENRIRNGKRKLYKRTAIEQFKPSVY